MRGWWFWPGSERPRFEADLLQHPAAQVLERHDVTAPTANETPEDEGGEDRERKEYEPRIDRAVLQRVHRLRGLDRRNGSSHQPPLDDVRDHQQIERDQRSSSPAACAGPAYGVLSRAAAIQNGQFDRSRLPYFLAGAVFLHKQISAGCGAVGN